MKRILMVTVATIILLWLTTNITVQASSSLQTRTFSTNLVKGAYVEAEKIEINENPEVHESVDDGLDDSAGEIITDRVEIAEPEPQESDEHTDVSTPTDIEPVVDEDDGELEEPTQSEEPDETIEEYIGETEEEIEEEHETEVQSTQ